MNDTRSMNRARRISARIAVVLCLLLAVGVVPLAAFAAPGMLRTVADVEASYLDSATINLMATGPVDKTFCQLDGGAVTEGDSVTTSIYGAHVLKFWSTNTDGPAEVTVTAPFFVDDSVAPELEADCEDVYTSVAEVELEATDNFNGSGVDFLCYRVDGGPVQTAMAPASLQAAKVLFARIAKVRTTGIVVAAAPPAITPTTPAPADHFGPPCSTCHQIIIPTPEPTTTPNPTGTPIPDGVECDVEVTGVGDHTIEYWAQDVARNETEHAVESFTIARTPTSLSFKTSTTSTRRYNYVTLSSKLSGGVAAGSHVRYEVRLPGRTSYSTITSSRDVSATGSSSYKYRVTKSGTYYFRVRFMGSGDFAPCMSKVVKVVVR